MKEHDHTPEEERRIREAALDETVAGSFPASDPASSLPNPDEHDAEGNGVEPADEAPSHVPDGTSAGVGREGEGCKTSISGSNLDGASTFF